VSATLDNPGSAVDQPYYQVEISGAVSPRTLEGQAQIAPGASQRIAWSIGPGDIDLGSFILVKLDVRPSGGRRTRQATCGVLVLPLGSVRGDLALRLAIGAYALLTIVGVVTHALARTGRQRRQQSNQLHPKPSRLLQTLGIAVSLAILADLAGWWTAALILCVAGLILLLISARYAFH
jgi:hypothetical protein